LEAKDVKELDDKPPDFLRMFHRKEKRRKDSAGSGDTASMIKGGGYLGARTRQPPTAQTFKKDFLAWVRGVVFSTENSGSNADSVTVS
jgi:hypothetical protein